MAEGLFCFLKEGAGKRKGKWKWQTYMLETVDSMKTIALLQFSTLFLIPDGYSPFDYFISLV